MSEGWGWGVGERAVRGGEGGEVKDDCSERNIDENGGLERKIYR